MGITLGLYIIIY